MTCITLARGATLTGAALLSGCLLLSACSSGVSGSSASSAGAPHAAPEPARNQPLNAGAQAAGPGSSAGGSAATQTARLAPASQSIIYTASVTLRSASAMAAAKRAAAIVTAVGGYTSAENAVASSGRSGATVSLTLKVPVAVYPQVLAELSAPSLGRQVKLTQQASDVTQQVADVNSLVSSQEAAISALQGLLRHAADVSQLLQVQQQISNDESTLESLQAQQRALNHETSYATVNMTLLSAVHRAPAHRRHPASGFAAGLGAGWRALLHATTWLLTALGVALPFLIIAVILAGLGYAARRGVRRRTGPTAAD